jgi:hypothetical protein
MAIGWLDRDSETCVTSKLDKRLSVARLARPKCSYLNQKDAYSTLEMVFESKGEDGAEVALKVVLWYCR